VEIVAIENRQLWALFVVKALFSEFFFTEMDLLHLYSSKGSTWIIPQM